MDANGKKKTTAPPSDRAARERMEQSILDRKKALQVCGACGSRGNWLTESVKKPVRYLICGHCGAGRCQVVVMPAEVEAALAGTATR
jgi:hypothetical protein